MGDYSVMSTVSIGSWLSNTSSAGQGSRRGNQGQSQGEGSHNDTDTDNDTVFSLASEAMSFTTTGSCTTAQSLFGSGFVTNDDDDDEEDDHAEDTVQPQTGLDYMHHGSNAGYDNDAMEYSESERSSCRSFLERPKTTRNHQERMQQLQEHQKLVSDDQGLLLMSHNIRHHSDPESTLASEESSVGFNDDAYFQQQQHQEEAHEEVEIEVEEEEQEPLVLPTPLLPPILHGEQQQQRHLQRPQQTKNVVLSQQAGRQHVRQSRTKILRTRRTTSPSPRKKTTQRLNVLRRIRASFRFRQEEAYAGGSSSDSDSEPGSTESQNDDNYPLIEKKYIALLDESENNGPPFSLEVRHGENKLYDMGTIEDPQSTRLAFDGKDGWTHPEAFVATTTDDEQTDKSTANTTSIQRILPIKEHEDNDGDLVDLVPSEDQHQHQQGAVPSNLLFENPDNDDCSSFGTWEHAASFEATTDDEIYDILELKRNCGKILTVYKEDIETASPTRCSTNRTTSTKSASVAMPSQPNPPSLPSSPKNDNEDHVSNNVGCDIKSSTTKVPLLKIPDLMTLPDQDDGIEVVHNDSNHPVTNTSTVHLEMKPTHDCDIESSCEKLEFVSSSGVVRTAGSVSPVLDHSKTKEDRGPKLITPESMKYALCDDNLKDIISEEESMLHWDGTPNTNESDQEPSPLFSKMTPASAFPVTSIFRERGEKNEKDEAKDTTCIVTNKIIVQPADSPLKDPQSNIDCMAEQKRQLASPASAMDTPTLHDKKILSNEETPPNQMPSHAMEYSDHKKSPEVKLESVLASLTAPKSAGSLSKHMDVCMRLETKLDDARFEKNDESTANSDGAVVLVEQPPVHRSEHALAEDEIQTTGKHNATLSLEEVPSVDSPNPEVENVSLVDCSPSMNLSERDEEEKLFVENAGTLLSEKDSKHMDPQASLDTLVAADENILSSSDLDRLLRKEKQSVDVVLEPERNCEVAVGEDHEVASEKSSIQLPDLATKETLSLGNSSSEVTSNKPVLKHLTPKDTIVEGELDDRDDLACKEAQPLEESSEVRRTSTSTLDIHSIVTSNEIPMQMNDIGTKEISSHGESNAQVTTIEESVTSSTDSDPLDRSAQNCTEISSNHLSNSKSTNENTLDDDDVCKVSVTESIEPLSDIESKKIVTGDNSIGNIPNTDSLAQQSNPDKTGAHATHTVFTDIESVGEQTQEHLSNIKTNKPCEKARQRVRDSLDRTSDHGSFGPNKKDTTGKDYTPATRELSDLESRFTMSADEGGTEKMELPSANVPEPAPKETINSGHVVVHSDHSIVDIEVSLGANSQAHLVKTDSDISELSDSLYLEESRKRLDSESISSDLGSISTKDISVITEFVEYAKVDNSTMLGFPRCKGLDVPKGLDFRASVEDIITKFNLGKEGQEAILSLQESRQEASEVSVAGKDDFHQEVPSRNIMGIEIPDYNAFVKQAVSKFHNELQLRKQTESH